MSYVLPLIGTPARWRETGGSESRAAVTPPPRTLTHSPLPVASMDAAVNDATQVASKLRVCFFPTTTRLFGLSDFIVFSHTV